MTLQAPFPWFGGKAPVAFALGVAWVLMMRVGRW